MLLSDPEPVLRNALEQIGIWQETEDRQAASAHLEVELEDVARGGGKCCSPHSWTSRFGEKEKIYRCLTEMVGSVICV